MVELRFFSGVVSHESADGDSNIVFHSRSGMRSPSALGRSSERESQREDHGRRSDPKSWG